jgi:hypothetical protein
MNKINITYTKLEDIFSEDIIKEYDYLFYSECASLPLFSVDEIIEKYSNVIPQEVLQLLPKGEYIG